MKRRERYASNSPPANIAPAMVIKARGSPALGGAPLPVSGEPGRLAAAALDRLAGSAGTLYKMALASFEASTAAQKAEDTHDTLFNLFALAVTLFRPGVLSALTGASQLVPL